MQGEYIILTENDCSLDISLTQDGKQFLIDSYNTDIDLSELNEDIFYELFEDIQCNSEYEYISDCSHFGHMSNAPIIHISEYDENGELIKHNKLWFYDYYAINNFVEVLYNKGNVIFTEQY